MQSDEIAVQPRDSAPITRFPYLVVRIISAAYQREAIDVRKGEPAVEIAHGDTFVQHPEPFRPDGSLSEGCRALLMEGVSATVVKTGYLMCVVWDEASPCSYVERDGKIVEHPDRPMGGMSLPATVAFEKPRMLR